MSNGLYIEIKQKNVNKDVYNFDRLYSYSVAMRRPQYRTR